MAVRRDSNSSIRLLKSGDKCCRTMNAIPVSAGRLEKKRSSDSRPPAEAPIPTIGKSAAAPLTGSAVLASDGYAREPSVCVWESSCPSPLTEDTSPVQWLPQHLSPVAEEHEAGQCRQN